MLPRPSTGTLFPYTTLFRSSPPLNNLKVRQALSLATNAKQLNEVVLKDAYFNAVSIVAPGAPGQKKENALGYDSRSEEHTSELQSRGHLVCRLLLETTDRS